MAIKYLKDFDQRCIASVVMLPEKDTPAGGEYVLYVAWEWERAVKDGGMKFYKSRGTLPYSTFSLHDQINNVCDQGAKVVDIEEIKRVFPPEVVKAIEEA